MMLILLHIHFFFRKEMVLTYSKKTEKGKEKDSVSDNVQTTLKAQVLVRSLKLSSVGHGQYLDG